MRRFRNCNPAAVMIYYLAVTAVTMFSMDPVFIGISLISSVLYCCLYTDVSARTHLFCAGLFAVLTIVNPLISHNGVTVLFYLNSRPFTLEALLYGAGAAGMVTATLYRLRALTADITAEKLLYVFGRVSPKLSLLLSVTLRYVSLFRKRWRQITDTQKALGLYKDGNLIDAAKGRMRVFDILITWSLENGIFTAQSMEARGFCDHRRTSFGVFRFRTSDLILILITAACSAFTIVGVLNSSFSYYPAISCSSSCLLSYAGRAAYAALSVLPVIINVKEEIKWRCLRSAI